MNLLRGILNLIIVLALHGCVTKGPYIPPPVSGIALNEMCVKYNVTWQWDGVTQVVILDYKGNKAKTIVGSNTVLVGKEKIFLSIPVQRKNSTIYVPEDFEAKVLAPFGIIPGGHPPIGDVLSMRVRTIVLDAGHGGKDPGARGHNGVKEKDIVFDVTKRVRTLLEDAGLKVILTRDNDEFISLPKRTEIATKTDADIFVSIHANSNPSKKTEGMEVYYVRTATHRDLEEEQRQINEKNFAKRLNAQYSPRLKLIVTDMMYAFKTTESKEIAKRIVTDGASYVNTPNRGARTCRFFVVRNTLIPAVLIELGYLSNPQEEKRLNSPEYRQKLAETISKSILNYAADS